MAFHAHIFLFVFVCFCFDCFDCFDLFSVANGNFRVQAELQPTTLALYLRQSKMERPLLFTCSKPMKSLQAIFLKMRLLYTKVTTAMLELSSSM